MKRDRLLYLLIAILTIWVLVLSIVLYTNYEDSNQKEIVNEYTVTGFSTDFTSIVENNKTGIVVINADGAISTGFAYKQIDNKIYIVTAYHGVNNVTNLNVFFSNSYVASGKIIGYDIYADLAVVEVEIPYMVKTLKLGDSCQLNAGEFVIGIGTPTSLEYANSVELGMISSLRTIENSISVDNSFTNYYLDVVQISSDFINGYSGCPILNMSGEVVGMVTMSSSSNYDFALTANEIKILADLIIEGQNYTKYQFNIKGLYVSKLENYEKSALNIGLDVINGLYVENISVLSPLYSAGIRKGDIITSINNIEIYNLNDYLSIAYSLAETFEFKVIRGFENYTFVVK